MELATTRKDVLDALNRTFDAVELVKILFPEVLDDPDAVSIPDFSVKYGPDELLAVRRYGHLAGKSVYLHPDYVWSIEQDDKDETVLVARRPKD